LRDAPVLEVRSDSNGMPVLTGHFAVWDKWTEINSRFEGHFLEKFSPTSMVKTLSEGKDKIRCLFQHGRDPQIGDKPLGPFERIEPDGTGAYYEVPLLDTSYNRDLIPGLKAGLYGASFRFEVVQEEFVQKPARSEHNPHGLPERTVVEARVREAGPVTFPAYADATAGLRSMTDEFVFGRYVEDPERLAELLEQERRLRREPRVTVTYGNSTGNTTTGTVVVSDVLEDEERHDDEHLESEPSEATTHSTIEESEPPEATTPEPGVVNTPRFNSREEWLEWISKI
jgi:HK97 family phage prohead protease